MDMMPLLIIIAVLMLVVGGVVIFTLKREQSKKDRIMNVIRGGKVERKASSDQDEQNKRRADIAKKLKESGDEEDVGSKKKRVTTAQLIAQAGLKTPVKKFWLISLGLGVGLAFFAKISGTAPIVVLFAFIIGLLGLPRFVLKAKAKKRQKKFLQEFPDALEATVRLLKAGMPVSEAIMMISKEYEGPVGEEMAIVYNKQKIGIPLHEAAMESTKRMPLQEMRMFATGLAIQAQTGASLSEVLTNLANVIRARFKLKRKIKALSSEAIASASIIGALPNVVAGGLWLVNPEYISLLFTTGTGKMLLGGAIIWMMFGVIAMKMMINFKI